MILIINGYCPLNLLDRLLNKISYEKSDIFRNVTSFKYNYYNDMDIFNYLNENKENEIIHFIPKIENENQNEINIIHSFNEKIIKTLGLDNTIYYDDKSKKLIFQ